MLEINGTVIIQIINLVIFFILAKMFFFKPIMETIQKRRETIESNITGAEKAVEDANQLKQTYERKIEDLQAEGNEILKKYREEGERIKSEIIQQAKNEAQQIIDSSTLEITNSKEQALEEVRGLSVNMAVSIAERLLADVLDTDVQKTMTDRLIKRVSTVYTPSPKSPVELHVVGENKSAEKVETTYDGRIGSKSILPGTVRTGDGKEAGEPVPE